MQELDAATIILSLILTWGVGLLPPVLIRYVFVKRPIAKWPSIGICAMFWFFNFILFTALGSTSKSHGALVLVAMVSYWILGRGSAAAVGISSTDYNAPSPPAAKPFGTYEPAALPSAAAAPPVPPSGGAVKAGEPNMVTPAESFVVDEDAIYASIANELESGATDKGLWIRLFAECDGDENRTRVAYIKQRAEKLIAAEKLRLAAMKMHQKEEAARLETMRFAGLSIREQLRSSNRSSELAEKVKTLSRSLVAAEFRRKVRTNLLDDVEAMLRDNPLLVAAIDTDDKTPLHIAVAEQHVVMCRLLLENGAPTDAKTMFGQTPLDFARNNRNQEIVEMLSAIK